MNGQPTTHPATEQLSAFGLGKLNDAAAAAIAQHLEGCLSCRKAVERVAGDTFVGLVRAAKAPASVAPSNTTPLPKDRNLSAPQAPAAPRVDLPPELAKHAKYRIFRELGRGGMGVVYQAEHIQMERLVAIKVINKSILEHPQALQRFAQEVRAAAKLSHPNIVAAFDFEQAGDLHMLVMEFVEGQNLADIVERRGPLPILNACHYVRQAALGLQHAFEKGMVHRDLKPQNLMLAPKGTVKLLDMGLARVESEKTDQQKKLTSLGATLGTPEYIAPEQAMDASKADIRSDIYSLGCTLYCLLAGRPPFVEATAVQMILAHLEKEPQPLSELRAEVPEKLAGVVARMMAKEPATRYQTPVEVAQALAPFSKPGAKGAVADPAPVARPAAPAAVRMPATQTMAAEASAVRWDTLTDGDAKGKVVSAKKAQKARSRPAGLAAKKKWLIGGAAAGVALLTVIVLIGLVGLWHAGVLRVPTKDGSTIVLENLPPDADVLVDGGKVKVTSSDGKTFEIRVDASQKNHRVEVKKDGFKVFGEEVEIDAGGRKSVVVRLEPKEKPADGGPTKVPAEKELPKTLTVDLGGGVKMEFVLIDPKSKPDGGKFRMGSPPEEKGRNYFWTHGFDVEKQHKVEITKPFYLAKYPMTQEQYKAIMGKNPSWFSASGGGSAKVAGLETKQFPVEKVAWEEADDCCKEMMEKCGAQIPAALKQTNYRFALPTEAQWEYACRAGSNTAYYFGDDPMKLDEYAWFGENSEGRTHPVGGKKSNEWGLHDMCGNVYQWCADWYGEYPNGAVTDPQGPTTGSTRIYRGGGWYSGDRRFYRSADRSTFVDPNANRSWHLGFRVAFRVD